MPSAFIIEIDGAGLYLRDRDDGALSWVCNPNKAKRFACDLEAERYASKRLSGDTIKVTSFTFTPW